MLTQTIDCVLEELVKEFPSPPEYHADQGNSRRTFGFIGRIHIDRL